MLESVVAQLKEHGYRITPQRRLILETIIAAQTLLTAFEIWQLVQQQYQDIGLDTIYRNLNMLADMGVLIPISGLGKESTRYELACTHHHHHVVCVKCGQAVCIDYCPIDHHFIAALEARGYELLRHHVELFGLCAACKAK